LTQKKYVLAEIRKITNRWGYSSDLVNCFPLRLTIHTSEQNVTIFNAIEDRTR